MPVARENSEMSPKRSRKRKRKHEKFGTSRGSEEEMRANFLTVFLNKSVVKYKEYFFLKF